MFEKIRAMTPEERIAISTEAFYAAIELQIAGLRMQYPEADEEELRRRAGARRLGREFTLRMCGKQAEAWLD